MRKSLLFFFLLVATLLGAQVEHKEAKQAKLQASYIGGDKTHLYARGDILLRYAQTLFTADFASYDKAEKRLIVEGNVTIISPDGSKVETEKVTLNIEEEHVLFEKFLYRDKENVWLSSVEATKEKECYKLKNAMFSTCMMQSPDWHLGFSEADYNATSKYIKLKDIRFYIGETPVFYFPYLAFSTAKERSSGLLMPHFGYSSKEGFVYEQPIYWAISPSMDIEFNPQVRTNRSLGMYATLRFADSNASEGLLRLGYFADKSGYATDYQLKNDTHYGLEAKYDSSDVLRSHKPESYQDALYANLVYFNDIDYLNLQKDALTHLSDSSLKESRINYMLYNPSYYAGLNVRYFIDANYDNNDATLQELPSVHLHKYASSLWLEDVSYSMDAKLSHFTRESGAGSDQLEISLPIHYHLSLLDDYLNVDLSEELYGYMGNFDTNVTDNAHYNTMLATHKIKFYTDLMRPYVSGAHTIEWSAEYAHQNYLGDGLRDYHALDLSLRRDFLSRDPFDDRVAFALSQYWHDQTLNLSAKQKVTQTYYPDRIEKWGDLRHELWFEYAQWSMHNLLEYSFPYRGLAAMSNRVAYHGEKLSMEVEHFWRKDLALSEVLTNELAWGASYQYDKKLKLFGNLTYDLEHKYSKKWRAGFRYDKGCWATELSYAHDTTPLLSVDGGDSVSNDTFMLRISLVPFGESEIRK